MSLADGCLRSAQLVDDELCAEIDKNIVLDRLLTSISAKLLKSLPRVDQRRKGVMYLRGLLGASGRKSVRNIAAFLGQEINDQGLHHFINDSTWNWAPIRIELADYVTRRFSPKAVVLQPMLIPKSGTHSVGVGTTYSAEHAHAVTAQQAVGIWLASDDAVVPVNWRLHVPDSIRRPGDLPPTAENTAISALLESVPWHRTPSLPVVVDATSMDGIRLMSGLLRARVPQLTRISGESWMEPADPTLTGWGPHPRQAMELAKAIKGVRSKMAPVALDRWGETEIFAGATVRLPVPGRGGSGPALLLLGVGGSGDRWPGELWATDMVDVDYATLLRLIRMSRAVGSSGMRRAADVGIRDFVGRSFDGWHRHATLASVAHTVAELADYIWSGN